jgi:hypothetical protein
VDEGWVSLHLVISPSMTAPVLKSGAGWRTRTRGAGYTIGCKAGRAGMQRGGDRGTPASSRHAGRAPTHMTRNTFQLGDAGGHYHHPKGGCARPQGHSITLGAYKHAPRVSMVVS